MIFNPMAVGRKLPDLSNPGAAADLLQGKQLVDQDGNVLTGTMPSVVQATPSISVSSGGLITASAAQSGGKVAAGTKSATKQLTTQGAQTITPGTSNKTIASGRYLTGAQTIKGDSNLVAGNIRAGASIFGVVGSYAGEGMKVYYDITDFTDSQGPYTVNCGFRPIAFVMYARNFGSVSSNCTYDLHNFLLAWNEENGRGCTGYMRTDTHRTYIEAKTRTQFTELYTLTMTDTSLTIELIDKGEAWDGAYAINICG